MSQVTYTIDAGSTAPFDPNSKIRADIDQDPRPDTLDVELLDSSDNQVISTERQGVNGDLIGYRGVARGNQNVIFFFDTDIKRMSGVVNRLNSPNTQGVWIAKRDD